jgi:long-chain acyl-CoA synthetase
MLVYHFLEHSARRAGGNTAIIDGARTVTFAELDNLSNRFASALLAHNIQRGDRVVLALENSIEFAAAYFGTMKAGAAAVPLPPGPRSDRLIKAIVDCEPAVCVLDHTTAIEEGSETAVQGVRTIYIRRNPRLPETDLPANALDLTQTLESSCRVARATGVIDLDLAAIIYTSGSTGEPRGVMLTHRNIVANTRSIIQYLELTERDRAMCVLPLYYVYGLSLLHTHLAVGGSIVLDNRFAFPNVVLDGMARHDVTGFAGVPSTFALLLDRSTVTERTLPALRYVTQAGGGMSPARVREWLTKGPRVPFFVMYGATEASARLTYLAPDDVIRKLGSIGRPISNVEIIVITDDGRVASPGEVGELVARGSNIAAGYWRRPEETAEKFSSLGYRTGDLGYVDDEGFVFLVGRRHDMIKVGAHRVGAKEIEDVLNEHPAVHEAAVIGIDDNVLGEVPVACVATRDGSSSDIDAEALRTFCRSRLPSHKVPVRFVMMSELPKLMGVGKVDKRALREALLAPLPLDVT